MKKLNIKIFFKYKKEKIIFNIFLILFFFLNLSSIKIRVRLIFVKNLSINNINQYLKNSKILLKIIAR